MVIFFTAVFTLKSNKMEEKHGRILKLIGGILMLALAVVMLVKPSLMSDLNQSLIVFGIAFAVTLLVLLIHRVILPKFGVYLGSEYTKKKKRKK
jgi:choline-glycine betaine transporter